MHSFQDILNAINTVYKTNLDIVELKKVLVSAEELSRHPNLSEDRKEIAEFLIIKLNAKIYALDYFCNGYEADAYSALKDYTDKTAASCDQTFRKTIELLKNVSVAAEKINRIASDAHALQACVRDCEGRCVASSAEKCLEIAEKFKSKISLAENLSVPTPLFNDGALFPDVKKQFIADLTEIRDFALESAKQLSYQAAASIIKTGLADITAKLKRANYEYLPSVINAERLANTLVLCTPFCEEAELFAYARSNGAAVYTLQALALENQPDNIIKAIFSELNSRKADCVIYGITHFRANNRNAFLQAVVDFGRGGRRAYIVTDDGTQKVYEAVLEAIKGKECYSSLDISLFYLSLPDFLPTVEELKELNMIADNADDIEWVRKNMPFTGFAGLNEGVKAFRAGADWRAIVAERSQDNYPLAEKYMLNLVRQALFIDGGWGNYHEDVVINKTKKFDYDDIRLVNPDNIRKIMQGNFTLFQKCGMISTYCLLAGASADEWKDLPVEMKSERLSEASKLVLRALDVDIIPVVEVKEDVGVKGAGGLCCDGGKKILYKESSVNNFDWTAKCVCHECFHAFQHKALESGWQEWYGTELHVTPGRVEQWRYNNSRYRSIEKGYEVYMIQIFESDARAFEEDCLGKDVNRGQILNLIDLD
ncbi:MAG: hypothetical protein ACI4MQ_01345 [Candidatus Coproplasma sp.]